MIIIGDKEVEGKNITIESRDKGNQGAKSIDKFIKKLKSEITKKIPISFYTYRDFCCK